MEPSIVRWVEENSSVLGQNIRAIREAQGLSRPTLAKRIEEATGSTMTETAIYYIETGKRQARPDSLEAIAAGLGVSVREIYSLPPSEPAGGKKNPPGLQEVLDKGLADPPPDKDELKELRAIRWRGQPDGVAFLFALQAIRRANR